MPDSNIEKCQQSQPFLFPPSVTEVGIQHNVYVFSCGNTLSKPPVLLLHELSGLSNQTIEYAKFLAKDFTVYVPLLFGEFGQSESTLNNFQGFIYYAFSGEWNAWYGKYETRPVVKWLRSVLDDIHNRHKEQSVGIIGMCLTGALPLALIGDTQYICISADKNGQKIYSKVVNVRDYVKALVVAQPTLPLFGGNDSSLGLLPKEFHTAIDQAVNKKIMIYGVRFRHDLIAKRDKHHTLKARLGDSYCDGEIKDSEYDYAPGKEEPLPKTAHSSLIFHKNKPSSDLSHPINNRRKQVSQFLIKQLSKDSQQSKLDKKDNNCQNLCCKN